MTAIESIAVWGAPKRIRTKQGNRLLRVASTTEDFWSLWRSNKEALKQAGVSVGKDMYGRWEACWWLPDMEADQKDQTSREASKATNASLDVPAPNGLQYLPYQIAGINYAMTRPAVLIGDEMGLGKTIQAIGRINIDPGIKTVLVICPASLKINWARELTKWLVRPAQIGIANGQFPDTDIVIINYDVLKKYSGQLQGRIWDAMIVDECHYLKNGKAQRTQQALVIPARIRMFLTGTPIVNRPAELWTLVKALDPKGLGANWSKYHIRYCNAYRTRWGWDVSGAANLDELQDRLRETFMVRRLKADVLTELPAKRRVIRELARDGAERILRGQDELDRQQQETRDALAAAAELAKASGDDATYDAAVNALTDFNRVSFTEMSKIRHELALAKVPAVVAYLMEALEDNDNQIVLFAHHLDVIDAIMAALAEAKISAVKLTGSCSQDARQKAVDDFQAGRARVFVGNIKAAGVGITLTASSHVIFAELDWVPGNVSQAEDRCHRIGQTDSVLVEHLVFDGSLDARMAKTLVEKQTIIDQALDQEHMTEQAAEPVMEIELAEVKVRASRKEYDELAAKITPEQIEAAHRAMRLLAAMDPDHALVINDVGFNRYDNVLGHHLANLEKLTPRQAVLAAKLANKYRRQIGSELLAIIKGERAA